MAFDPTNYEQPGQGTGSAEQTGRERSEQFNELSELSLEERMNAADQLGVPSESVIDTAATGAMSGSDDLAGGLGERMEDESTGEETSA